MNKSIFCLNKNIIKNEIFLSYDRKCKLHKITRPNEFCHKLSVGDWYWSRFFWTKKKPCCNLVGTYFKPWNLMCNHKYFLNCRLASCDHRCYFEKRSTLSDWNKSITIWMWAVSAKRWLGKNSWKYQLGNNFNGLGYPKNIW